MVPEHAPLQLLNCDPFKAAAASETWLPGKLSEEQLPPVSLHEIKPSLEVTVPEPPPVTDTLSVIPSTKAADTLWSELMVTLQLGCELGVLEQAPPQLWSSDPASGEALRFTTVPLT